MGRDSHFSSKKARVFNEARTKFLENGDTEALKRAKAAGNGL